MNSYIFLLSIAIILIATKGLGDLTNKVHMPQVVGALMAGVILGPSCLGWIEETDFISKTAEIGVILLMFTAGFDTDINEMKKNSKACVIIAILGVFLPLIGGTLCYYFFFEPGTTDYDVMLKSIFVGVILTATSVSITVEALREMGKLDGKAGNAILGAAIIDDILGILVLTIVISMKDPTISILSIVIKIVIYVMLIGVLWFIAEKKRGFIDANCGKRRVTTYVLAFCLIVAFVTEHYFGIADITGAYLFGLILSNHRIKKEVARKLAAPSYLFFSPIFFASIGLKVELDGLNSQMIIFSLILLAVAVATKIIGCGIGAKICGFAGRDALQVGVGMVSRGEVALIVAQKGFSAGLINESMFPPIVIVVIVTTIITPIVLRKIM